jgi:serine/threonine protein kinase
MRWPSRIGRWEIRSLLGAGGVAEVLLGVDDAGNEAALKRVVAERSDDAIQADALRMEAYLLSRLHHPNVVGLIELVDGPAPALALERLHGCTLNAIMGGDTPATLPASFEPLDVPLALDIAAQAASALVAVHTAVDESRAPLDAVHRDVSPDNLFVVRDGRVKLFDFNVSFFRGHARAPEPGALQGRVAYMAPEQARGEPVDGRADVFALGAVLWEMVVGERLFWRGTTMASLAALMEPAPRARAARALVPPALDELIATMLAPDPRARPTTGEVVRHLRNIEPTIDGEGVEVRARLATLVAPRMM